MEEERSWDLFRGTPAKCETSAEVSSETGGNPFNRVFLKVLCPGKQSHQGGSHLPLSPSKPCSLGQFQHRERVGKNGWWKEGGHAKLDCLVPN